MNLRFLLAALIASTFMFGNVMAATHHHKAATHKVSHKTSHKEVKKHNKTKHRKK